MYRPTNTLHSSAVNGLSEKWTIPVAQKVKTNMTVTIILFSHIFFLMFGYKFLVLISFLPNVWDALEYL